MAVVQTVLGLRSVDELGLMLPHEHLFTDLRPPDTPGQGEADPEDVWRVMGPYLERAWQHGVTALVECSPWGVGRNARVLEYLAKRTPVAIIMPTGVYREGYFPQAALDMSEGEVADWMLGELTAGIAGTSAKAGFIKLAVSNEAISANEARHLQAAARAARAAGVIVASHTSGPLGGEHALQELDILEAAGLPGDQFNWVHAQHASLDYHRRAVERGAYIGFDGMRLAAEEQYVRLVLDALGAGLDDHILLSHDAGWYRPGEPDGGASQVQGFTYLVEGFLPRLRREGVSEADIKRMTEANPKRAFAVRGV